uniref:Odorant binding protein 12 n=1 Tax=Chrysoperla nipponensis TaxID=413239 RepID=A0A0R8PDP8_CHRNP|nr:odorant binding protein 12 [Chrysoperla nipponensis]
MLLIICLVITALVSFSQSYDVNIDEIFSNLLSDEGHEHLGQRFKRDPHPHHKMDCCGDPPPIEESRELLKDCFKNRQKRDRPHGKGGGMKRGLCVAECIAKKMNIANDNGIVDKAAFVEEYKKFDPDTWRQEQVEKSYDICIEAAEKFKQKKAEKHGNFSCNPQAAGFFHCQMREVILNCPDDKFNADKGYCAKIRDKSQTSHRDKSPETIEDI